MALPRVFAVSGGAVAVCLCALAFVVRKVRLAVSIEELGGSIMRRRGGVVDRCGV